MATTTSNPVDRLSVTGGGEVAPDRAAVREQLAHLLDSSLFRSSRRYPGLLRYIVERKLDGHIEQLKERILGVEVFGRRADYDTNQDPIVRVSAAEIRKRIAQYYHEPGHETELRIELPLGSYVPEFHPPLFTPTPVPRRGGWLRSTLRRDNSWWWIATLATLAAMAAVAAVSWKDSSPGDQFWRPLLQSGSPVLLCAARSPLVFGHLVDPANFASRPSNVAWPDAVTLAKLTGLIQANGQRYEIRREDQASFTDLRQGPAVLIGAFNDSWTMRLMSEGRFSFQREGAFYWIRDQQNPTDRHWSIDLSHLDSNGLPVLAQDYAVISRVSNPKTGNLLVIVAGLWGYGTQAAGEFLTNRRFLDSLAAQAPPGWERKNMQVVIGTEVIDHSPSPPRILAVHSW